MDFEIEFFPVGDSAKAGDAIVARYGNNGQYAVSVIDGGTEDSGSAIVEHIRSVYGTTTVIDHVISSHPDTDHASGLRKILEALPVRNLWLHGVWHHAGEMLPYFEDKRWTKDGLEAAIRKEYPIIKDLLDLAAAQNTPVYESFAGQPIGPFVVLSPTSSAYTRLVPQFRRTPAPDADRLKAENMWLGEPRVPSLLGAILEKAVSWIPEFWEYELLREGAVTAAENETSTILYGYFGSTSVLLTADAGVNALWWATTFAQQNGIDLSTLNLIQVPHHGSRSNVTPSVLNRLEPISKSFEEDDEASELHEAKEVLRIKLPADKDAALPLNPGEEPFDQPAPGISPESASILRRGLAAIGAVRRDHLDAVFA